MNQLAEVNNYNITTKQPITTYYTYDGSNNRIGKTVEQSGTLIEKTTYTVDSESAHNNIIQAKDSLSGNITSFLYREDLISDESNQNLRYYRTDEKHSITDLLDSTGIIKTSIYYDEYGVVKNPEAVHINGNLFAYTGHVYDESTGFYYAKDRYIIYFIKKCVL